MGKNTSRLLKSSPGERIRRNTFCYFALRGLVYLLMLTIALPAFTQPLEKFCLIQASQSGEGFAEMVDISFKSVTRNFTVKGKSYRLVSGKDHVELQDENGKLLEMEMARQEEGGFIEDFVFHKSHSQQVENDKSMTDGDTLLIEGGTDYVVRIQLEDSIPKLYDIEKYVNLKFKAGGQSYRLVTEGYKRGFGKYGDKFGFLGLVDGQNRFITSIPIQIPRGSEFFHIYDLALSKNGWLWVDGSDADYLVHVDLNTTPPTFGAPLELSKLTQTECWPGSWFFGCAATKGYYSRALERVFVSTRKHTFFGLLPLIKRQIIDGEPKELPDELKNAKLEKFSYWEDSQRIIFRDLPSLNGAVFFGEEGEALFYDGKRVIPMMGPKYNEKTPLLGIEIAPITKRVFLWFKSYDKWSLQEIKPDLKRNSILVFNELEDSKFYLHEFSHQPYVFWLGMHGLSIEMEGVLRTIIIVPKPKNIGESVYIGLPPNDAIAFSVHDLITKKMSGYFIVRASPTVQCMRMLDPNNPF